MKNKKDSFIITCYMIFMFHLSMNGITAPQVIVWQGNKKISVDSEYFIHFSMKHKNQLSILTIIQEIIFLYCELSRLTHDVGGPIVMY